MELITIVNRAPTIRFVPNRQNFSSWTFQEYPRIAVENTYNCRKERHP